MKPVFILAAILIFGLLIAVHEFGHFITAKLCGVRVNEFSIGMGPCIWSREKGETLYSLRALPVGGYCAMEGEDEDTGDDRSFVRQGFWKKFLILFAGSGMNFIPIRSPALHRSSSSREKLALWRAIFFTKSMDTAPICGETPPCF